MAKSFLLRAPLPYVLLVFSVTPFKIDQNKKSKPFNRLSPESCWCHVGAHLDGHQHGGRKPVETSVTEFCYKSVNLSLEELKNVKIILYSNTRTVQITEFPEISHLLNRHHRSLA